jgi:hypothetical protein
MATGDERHEDLVEHLVLPDDALADLGAQALRGGQEGVAVRLRSGGGGAQRTGRRWR